MKKTEIETPLGTMVAIADNGKNPFMIIIPCHRVIKTNDDIVGYNSGIARKKWLLLHEQSYLKLKQ